MIGARIWTSAAFALAVLGAPACATLVKTPSTHEVTLRRWTDSTTTQQPVRTASVSVEGDQLRVVVEEALECTDTTREEYETWRHTAISTHDPNIVRRQVLIGLAVATVGGVALGLAPGLSDVPEIDPETGEELLSQQGKVLIVGGAGVVTGTGLLLVGAYNAGQARDRNDRIGVATRVEDESTYPCNQTPVTGADVTVAFGDSAVPLGATDGGGVVVASLSSVLRPERVADLPPNRTAAVLVVGERLGRIDLDPLARSIETAAWADASEADTREAYANYIRMFPAAEQVPGALSRIEAIDRAARLAAEDEVWARAQADGSPEGWRAYLVEYPNGRYALLANQAIAAELLDADALDELEALLNGPLAREFDPETARLRAALDERQAERRARARERIARVERMPESCSAGAGCSDRNADIARDTFAAIDSTSGIDSETRRQIERRVLSRCGCTRSAVGR